MRFFQESAVKLRTFKSYSKLYCRACRELPSSPEAPGDRSYAIVRCALMRMHLEALAYLSFLDRQVGQGHDYEQQHHEQRGWHILRQLQCRRPGNGWNRRTSSYLGILGSWSRLARSHNFVPGYSSCNRSQPHGIFREAGAKGPMGPPWSTTALQRSCTRLRRRGRSPCTARSPSPCCDAHRALGNNSAMLQSCCSVTGIEGLEPVKIVLSIVHMLMPVFMHAWKNNRHLYACVATRPRCHGSQCI